MKKNRWKTKEIADSLSVTPSTVKRWIKYYHLPYESNSQGHFEMDEDTYYKLKHIHLETQTGKKLKDIHIPGVNRTSKQQHEKMVSSQYLDEKFDRLLLQLEQLDRQLHEKADEVVEYQVLQQRKEINELNDLVYQLTDRLKSLEHQMEEKVDETVLTTDIQKEPMKRRKLASIFSL